MKHEVTIVSAADDRYFDGLLVTLASLLVSSKKPGITYRLHVLDGGIEDGNWQKLEKTLGKIDRQFELSRHLISEEAFADFPSLHFPSKMYYARLFLHRFVNEDRIVYVDSDILFLRDVSELAGLDREYGIQAAIDQTVKTVGADISDAESYGVNSNSRHLNSGVMVIDRRGDPPGDKVLKDAFVFLEKNPTVCATVDQTAINMVLDDRFHELDRTWNFMSNHVCLPKDMPHLIRRDVNIHYVTKLKPWLVYSNEFAFLMYYEFCRSIGYELKAIRSSYRKHFMRLAAANFRPAFFSVATSLFGFLGMQSLSESFAKRKRIAEEFVHLQKKQAAYRRDLLASLKGWAQEIQRELR